MSQITTISPWSQHLFLSLYNELDTAYNLSFLSIALSLSCTLVQASLFLSLYCVSKELSGFKKIRLISLLHTTCYFTVADPGLKYAEGESRKFEKQGTQLKNVRFSNHRVGARPRPAPHLDPSLFIYTLFVQRLLYWPTTS